jgi:hypothetical protein
MTLNKSQLRAVQIDIQHYNNGNHSAAARGLSALYRSARKTSQQEEILKLAMAYSLVNHPDFYA